MFAVSSCHRSRNGKSPTNFINKCTILENLEMSVEDEKVRLLKILN